ncbi:MAG: GDP-mannose 4,6-dehydratase [Candidatus Methanomethyliaceae archaeon]
MRADLHGCRPTTNVTRSNVQRPNVLTVLITGCAGFIGWKVTEFLLADGHTVVGVDNLNDAYDVRLKRWRLAQLEGKAGFEFHRLDITDRSTFNALTP